MKCLLCKFETDELEILETHLEELHKDVVTSVSCEKCKFSAYPCTMYLVSSCMTRTGEKTEWTMYLFEGYLKALSSKATRMCSCYLQFFGL